MSQLSTIEGIGETIQTKLKAAGVTSVEDLLAKGGTSAGRATLAESSGISEKQILEWVNRADLSRINGIGSEFADLLEAAGVDSVPELAQRNASSLYAKLSEINESKNLVRRTPSESEVARFIEEAKTLPKAVFH